MSSVDFLTGILDVLARSARARDPRESLSSATEAFRHLVPFDGGGLLLPEREPHQFDLRGYELWSDHSDAEPGRLSADAAIARAAEGAQELVAARDDLPCEESRAAMIALGHASVVALPLRVDDRAIGALLLFGDDADAFATIELAPLLAGASIVAVAIEHARDRLALQRLANELGLDRSRHGHGWIIREDRAGRSSGDARKGTRDLRTLAEIERDAIARVLAHTGGRVSGPRGAAAILGMKPTTLQSRMKKLGVRRAGRGRARAPSARGALSPP